MVPGNLLTTLSAPLILPIPADPNALLLIFLVFIGVMAIIYNVHPEIVLGLMILVCIVYGINLLWPYQTLAVIYGLVIVLIVAIMKLAAIAIEGGVKKGRNWLNRRDGGSDPETVAAVGVVIATVVGEYISRRRGRDRE